MFLVDYAVLKERRWILHSGATTIKGISKGKNKAGSKG
jgi:hypothetical protein